MDRIGTWVNVSLNKGTYHHHRTPNLEIAQMVYWGKRQRTREIAWKFLCPPIFLFLWLQPLLRFQTVSSSRKWKGKEWEKEVPMWEKKKVISSLCSCLLSHLSKLQRALKAGRENHGRKLYFYFLLEIHRQQEEKNKREGRDTSEWPGGHIWPIVNIYYQQGI